jgi:hypothetical protein
VDAATVEQGRFDIIEDRARQYLSAVAAARQPAVPASVS